MEIDEHKKEAERITAENKAGKDKASELSGAVGKAMQDQLVGKKYGEHGERLPAAAGGKSQKRRYAPRNLCTRLINERKVQKVPKTYPVWVACVGGP